MEKEQMEVGDALEGLDEAELRQKLDKADTYQERSKIRSALRRMGKSSVSQLDSFTTDVAGAVGASSSPPQTQRPSPAAAQATYRRPGYQVQKDPPRHYGVRHWESVDSTPGSSFVRRPSQSKKSKSGYAFSAEAASETASKGNLVGRQEDTNTSSANARGGNANSQITGERADKVSQSTSAETMGAVDQMDGGSGVAAEVVDTASDLPTATADPSISTSVPAGGDGSESGYRSESRMSTTSIRSEGGESVVSVDSSLQSDLELEETLQKQIEASQDFEERRKLRAQKTQVQHRRLSRSQLAGSPDCGADGYSSGRSSTTSAKTEEPPSWVKLARKKSNPTTMMETQKERRQSRTDAGEEVYKSVQLRKTGRLERKSSMQELERPTAPAQPQESPYKSVQLKRTGTMERRTSVHESERPAAPRPQESPYKSVQLKKTGTLERRQSVHESERPTTPSQPQESPYKSVQLKKTGTLERRLSVHESERPAAPANPAESPYKSVQLKKTGVLDSSKARRQRKDSDTQASVEPVFQDVELKRTGSFEVAPSGSVKVVTAATSAAGRRDSVSSAESPMSPYKSIQLKKTGVLDSTDPFSSTSQRQASMSKNPMEESPYKSATAALRRTGKPGAERGDLGQGVRDSDDSSASSVSGHYPLEPTSSHDNAAEPAFLQPQDESGSDSQSKTTSTSTRPNTIGISANDDVFSTPSKAEHRTSTLDRYQKKSTAGDQSSAGAGGSPWKIALKKVGTPSGKSVTLGRRDSSTSTTSTSSTVDYLSVLRNKKRNSMVEVDGGAQPSTDGGTRQTRSSTTQSPAGADYLSVLRRRQAGAATGNGADGACGEVTSSSASKRLAQTPKKTESELPNYRSVLRRSIKKSDSNVLDDYGRPKLGSQTVDYLAVLKRSQGSGAGGSSSAHLPSQSTGEESNHTTTSGLSNGDNRDAAADSLARSLEFDSQRDGGDSDIILPGGVHVTTSETDV